ncbi:MAG: response regulator [Chloroflexi bacterium]|jgi:two-component system cell cycle response regulator DivK|uniref:response regulator n=1 Tax=Candidatus Flexifilum breve TaxID=3140694 RepID=UPI003134673B|nr:response regulator [Chloroflexota bacterium]MBK9747117.1 response regulator [Chloroflexota bacterium]
MGSPHALIIEDNSNNSEVLAILLELQGVASTNVRSTRQVASTIEQLEHVDVIFLDLEFPYGDGFSVFKLLRSDPRYAAIPIIAYSVHISQVDKVRAAGFQGFLGKPLSIEQFPDQLRRILSGIAVWEV